MGELNRYIPDESAAQRVALICIYSDPDMDKQSGYTRAHGKGAILLSRRDFDANVAGDTIAHEGAHAVFEFHAAGSTSGTGTPSSFALRIAHLYTRLMETTPVPIPSTQFDPATPPSLTAPNSPTREATSLQPAGVVMVLDTLWGTPGGHPWDSADEFLASALAGFIQQPERLRLIIAHYQAADERIGPLAKELLGLPGHRNGSHSAGEADGTR